jgi:hypothetical protein
MCVRVNISFFDHLEGKQKSKHDGIFVFVQFEAAVTILDLAVTFPVQNTSAFEDAIKYQLVNQWREEEAGKGQFVGPHDLEYNPLHSRQGP